MSPRLTCRKTTLMDSAVCMFMCNYMCNNICSNNIKKRPSVWVEWGGREIKGVVKGEHGMKLGWKHNHILTKNKENEFGWLMEVLKNVR